MSLPAMIKKVIMVYVLEIEFQSIMQYSLRTKTRNTGIILQLIRFKWHTVWEARHLENS